MRSRETSMFCDHIVNNNDQNTPLSVNSSIENRNIIKQDAEGAYTWASLY